MGEYIGWGEYIGCQIILAEPAENQEGKQGYRVVSPDGYMSWSPKDVFEKAYRKITEDELNLIK